VGAMILTAGAAPAFLSKPLIGTDSLNNGGIAVASGDAFKHRAFDMSPNTAATSAGQNSDLSTWTYQAKQYYGSAVNAQPVDCLALLNINFKRFKVEYRVSGGAWTIFPGADLTGSDFAADHLILPLDPAGTVPLVDEWLVTVTSTQVPDQEKSLGLFLPCVQKFQASTGTAALDPGVTENIVTVETMDKSKDETQLLHNDADYDFMSTPLLFHPIPAAEEGNYSGLRGDFFLFVPQPGDYPNAWHLCRVVPSSYKAAPFSMALGENRKRISLSVEEVGGA
jgi:hypothetical protein